MTPNETMAKRFQQLVLTSTTHGSSSIQASAVSDKQHERNQTDEDQSMVDNAVSLGLTISNLLKDVADMAGFLPYVNGIAGIVSQLLQIRQELQSNKRRCNELLEKVLRNGNVVVEQCVMLKGYHEEGRLEPFFQRLEAYHRLLEDVYRLLQKFKRRRRFVRLFNRGLDEFNELDRRIDSFERNVDSIGITQILAEMKAQHEVIEIVSSMPTMGPIAPLPPRPIRVLERDTQREEIIAALLSSSDARVAVLGMGGIGKTTLACSAMRDPKVTEAYPRSLFVSFEGLSTTELVYNSLANTFSIPTESRKSNAQVLEQIKDCLAQEKTILCVDNFETFWEVPENRREADDLIGHLASLSALAIIVTLRGTQSPGNSTIRWVRIGPLPPLTRAGSDSLVREIAGNALGGSDTDILHNLCEAIDGVPLAVTLIGNLLRDGSETPESLWDRWTTERTRVIGTGVEDRQYQLDVSLRLSVFGPRMSDDSRAVLAVIAVLPAGLSEEKSWLDEFQGILSSSLNLRECLRVLRDTALCSRELNSTTPRVQLLSPVREFCIKAIQLDVEAIHKLVDFYTKRLSKYLDVTVSSEYDWFTTELTNITAILNLALSLPYITDSLAYACASYTSWVGYLGSPTTDIICKATDAQAPGSKGKAKCLQSHAFLLVRQSQNEEAVKLLQEALSIHRDLKEQVEEAWDLEELGRCYRTLERYDDAEVALNDALKLRHEQEELLGEANCLRNMANLYDDMGKDTEAETSAKQALQLYCALEDRLGEVNTLNLLGWMYREQGKLVLAIVTAEVAYRLSTEIKYTIGQAKAMRNLGLAQWAGGSLDQAASCLRESIQLLEKSASFVGAEAVRGELSLVLSGLANETET